MHLASNIKFIECLRCFERYSLQDIADGRYWIGTFICTSCYAKMQAKPHDQSCFGKVTAVEDGCKLLGYDPQAEECSKWCPDRRLCADVVNGAMGIVIDRTSCAGAL